MNHILKFALLAMTAVLSVVSAYLTATFMSDIGKNVGLEIPFAAAGLALDVIKTILPAAVVLIWTNGHKNGAIAGGLVAIALTALSMMASFNSIESSVAASQGHNREASLKQTKIDHISLSIQNTIDQQKVYTDAGMATKAASLNGRIDVLNKKLEQAQSQTIQTIKPTVGKAGIAIISAVIELACITGLMVASSMKTQTTENVGATMLRATSTTTTSQTTTTMQATSFDEAKDLIISGHVKPSERKLADAMNIPRYHAASLLAALEDDGTLIKNGRTRLVAV